MADEEINYVKEVLKSDFNLGFVGVMAFLMMVINFPGFLALLAAGEIGALFIAQDSRVQRIIRSRKHKDEKLETEDSEKSIVAALPAAYQSDFTSVRTLCDEIERRSGELEGEGSNALLSGVVALERCSESAQLTASTTLPNSAMTPSPISFTMRPLWAATAGSKMASRCRFRAAGVPASSAPIRRE